MSGYRRVPARAAKTVKTVEVDNAELHTTIKEGDVVVDPKTGKKMRAVKKGTAKVTTAAVESPAELPRHRVAVVNVQEAEEDLRASGELEPPGTPETVPKTPWLMDFNPDVGATTMSQTEDILNVSPEVAAILQAPPAMHELDDDSDDDSGSDTDTSDDEESDEQSGSASSSSQDAEPAPPVEKRKRGRPPGSGPRKEPGAKRARTPYKKTGKPAGRPTMYDPRTEMEPDDVDTLLFFMDKYSGLKAAMKTRIKIIDNGKGGSGSSKAGKKPTVYTSGRRAEEALKEMIKERKKKNQTVVPYMKLFTELKKKTEAVRLNDYIIIPADNLSMPHIANMDAIFDSGANNDYLKLAPQIVRQILGTTVTGHQKTRDSHRCDMLIQKPAEEKEGCFPVVPLAKAVIPDCAEPDKVMDPWVTAESQKTDLQKYYQEAVTQLGCRGFFPDGFRPGYLTMVHVTSDDTRGTPPVKGQPHPYIAWYFEQQMESSSNTRHKPTALQFVRPSSSQKNKLHFVSAIDANKPFLVTPSAHGEFLAHNICQTQSSLPANQLLFFLSLIPI